MSITFYWNGHSGDGVTVMSSRGWFWAMVAQIEQLALKFRMDAFIPGQYTEWLAWVFMPSTPCWAECKQRSTFPLRDLGTTILPSINIGPLSVLSRCCTSQKSQLLGSVRERECVCVWKEILGWLSLAGLCCSDHFGQMPECGQMSW